MDCCLDFRYLKTRAGTMFPAILLFDVVAPLLFVLVGKCLSDQLQMKDVLFGSCAREGLDKERTARSCCGTGGSVLSVMLQAFVTLAL